MDITTIFNQFAFPVAVVMALMWGMVKMFAVFMERLKEKDVQIAEQNAQHAGEIAEFTESLKSNTVVLERLCTLLGDREGTVV